MPSNSPTVERIAKQSQSEFLADFDHDILMMEEHANALVGVVEQFGRPPIACYDRDQIIRNLILDGCTEEEAIEHFDFNIIGGWVGEHTPCFLVATHD